MNTIKEDAITLARKRDALALAQLILDVYNKKKRESTLVTAEKVDQ